MEFAAYFDFRNPYASDPAELYAQTLEQVCAVEELGYDYAFASEHHFIEDGYLPSVLTMAAAMAMKTTTIKIGTFILLLPLNNALRVAEDAAVVDILSNGRLVLGVSGGYRREEFEALGVRREERGEIMTESLAVLHGAWKDEPFTFSGKHYRFCHLHVTPKPIQRPRPPLWVGGFAKSAVERAVANGDVYVIGGVNARASYAYYLEALDKLSKTRDDVRLGGNRVVHVAESDELAWERVKEAVMYQQNLYASWFAEAADKDASGGGRRVVRGPEALPRGDYIVGSPQTCIERITQWHKEIPIDIVTFCGNLPGMPREQALSSLELFATKVAPEFR